MSSCCHSPSAKPSEQAWLWYLWLCSKHHLCASTLPKSHSFPATEGTAEILFCPPSKRHHQPVDEQRIECLWRVQQDAAGLQSQGKRVAKRVQNVPSSHITSIPKNEYWFPKPTNWVIGSPFGAGRAHKNYSLDFLLLCPFWQKPLTVVGTHLCHGTPRDLSTPRGSCCTTFLPCWHTTTGKWAWFAKDTWMIQKIFESILVSSPSIPTTFSPHFEREKMSTINCPQPFNMRLTNHETNFFALLWCQKCTAVQI